MNPTNQNHPQIRSRIFQRRFNALRLKKPSASLITTATLILLAMLLVPSARAAALVLKASDGGGTSSFTTPLTGAGAGWVTTVGSGTGVAATSGNTYTVSNNALIQLRTPAAITSGNNYIFQGDSLTLGANSRLLGKFGNNGAATVANTITITNLILNGGYMDAAGGNGGQLEYMTVAGNLITITSASGLGANGPTVVGAFETLDLTAPISGSAALAVSGASVNGGADSGLVKLSAANPYSGTITVTNGVIASAVNRLLQLNNLNALSNATLNVNSVLASPVSFASGVNTGPFNLGALMGAASQTLTDTAGAAVTLNVGGNNASTTYSGGLTDGGAGAVLVKTGAGTLTLAGTNTYIGSTTVSNGTLALAVGGFITNSALITVNAGATLDVSANNFVLAASQSLAVSGTVNGSVTAASGAIIYAGNAGTYGTNTVTANLTYAAGALGYLDLGTTFNGANDLITVGGNLALNSTAFHLNAPSTSVNLDTTADYTLITVAGTITGSAASTPTWDTAPLNAANYSIVQVGNSIKLHYTVSAPPTGTGSASPNPVSRNQGTVVSVTVASSSHPISSVILNASSLGGSSALALTSAGGGVWTNTVFVGASVTPGSKTLVATITDNASLSGTTPNFFVTVSTASQTWNGAGANDNWSTSPNWASGAAPGYVGDTLTFAGTARLTPNMETSYSVTDVTFDSTAGSFVIGTSGNSLTLTGGGVANNSANPQTLNIPITTAAAETFNAAAGNLTFGQAITNSGNLVTVNGGYNVTVNGGISGAGGLENDNSAILMLTSTNTFTGGIVNSSGTLQITGAGLLGDTNGNYAGNITNSGVLQYSSSATQTLAGVISYYGSVIKDGSGKLILAGNNTYFNNTYISNGVLQVTGTLANDIGNNYIYTILDNGTLQWSGPAVQTISGIISGSGGLIMDGTGTLNLNAANTYSGPTVVSGGTLVYSPNTITYPTVSALTINGGGTVTVNANNSSSLAVGSLTLNTNAVLNLNYNFSGGNPTVAAISTATLSTPDTNVLRVAGYGASVGQFSLIAYTGASPANLNHYILGLPPGVTGNLVNNTGSKTIDVNITAASPATWIPLTANDVAGTSSFTNAGHWQDGNPPTTGNGYYTQGNVLRSPADANAYTFGGSALSIDQYQLGGGSVGGRFLLKGPGGAVITVPNLILNGGLMDYANASGDNGVETVAGNLTLNGGTTSYMGALSSETLVVTAPISGTGNLQIGGNNVNAGSGGGEPGVVALSGANAYSGSTTVATGILLANGTAPNTTVTVLTNATLGGTGGIGGTMTVQFGGTLAPGISALGALTNTIGTLTAGGAVSVSGGMVIKINRSASPNSDELAAPSVTINSGSILTVKNIGSTNLVAGDTFTLFSASVSGSFGVTNLPALPSSSLAWTNKLALDGTIAVVSTSVGPSGPEHLTNSYSAGTGILSLSWPANEGWRLQAQTNSLSQGLGTNWVYVTDGTVSSTNLSINVTNGSVFYRLTYP
jgi:fibronectin-binding autotransporter adhesin